MKIEKVSALLVVDVQKGFDDPKWGRRNNLDAELNIRRLIESFRNSRDPVIHVQHCSEESGSPLRSDCEGNLFKDEAAPIEGEVVFQKSVNSAFIGTDLEAHLKRNRIEELIIVGLTTDHCISTTTRMASNLGFDVLLVSDATATFDRNNYDGSLFEAEQIHEIHLASLHREFCLVKSTQEILEK